MSTRRIPILNSPIPNSAALGNVHQTPYDVYSTNDVWRRLVTVFEDTSTRIGLSSHFDVPADYIGSPAIIVVWTSSQTSGDIVWDFDYRSVGGDNAESLDQATAQESVTVTDDSPTAANNRLECQIPLTASNILAGDELEYELFRDGTDAADTMAAPGLLFNLLFQYSDV